MWHTGSGMGWWMLFGGVMWLVVVGLIVYVAARLCSAPMPHANARPESAENNAMEIARRRYANGELTRDEFVRLYDDLTKNAA